MGRFLRKFDLYGTAVGVNYQGDAAYKTNAGAFLTLLTAFIILVFGITKCFRMSQRTLPSFVSYVDHLDLIENFPATSLGEHKIKVLLAFSLGSKAV